MTTSRPMLSWCQNTDDSPRASTVTAQSAQIHVKYQVGVVGIARLTVFLMSLLVQVSLSGFLFDSPSSDDSPPGVEPASSERLTFHTVSQKQVFDAGNSDSGAITSCFFYLGLLTFFPRCPAEASFFENARPPSDSLAILSFDCWISASQSTQRTSMR